MGNRGACSLQVSVVCRAKMSQNAFKLPRINLSALVLEISSCVQIAFLAAFGFLIALKQIS